MTIEELLESSSWQQLQKIAERIDFQKDADRSWKESVEELLVAIEDENAADAILAEFAPPLPRPLVTQPELAPPPPAPKPKTQFPTRKLRAMGVRIGRNGDKVRHNLQGKRVN